MTVSLRWLGFSLLLLLVATLLPRRVSAVPPTSPLPQAVAQPATLCPAQLPTAIEAIMNRPAFARSRWGGLVQTLASNRPHLSRTLYAREAERYFIPASNVKLLTTAAVLKTLGAKFRFRTSVYGAETTAGWTLHLVGRGDPSFTETALQQLAQQLSRRGIRQVNQLIVDDTYYPGDWLNPTWAWGDLQSGYGASANSLILNENAMGVKLTPQKLGQPLLVEWENPQEAKGWQIDNKSVTVATNLPELTEVGQILNQSILTVKGQLRVGGEPDFAAVAIGDPAQNFLNHFQQALAKATIQVDRAIVINRPTTVPTRELAFVESAPLSELIKTMNRDSSNLYAESLLRSLGATNQPTGTSLSALELGLATLITTLRNLGLDPTSFALTDGSGLSRYNSVSPAALVQVLQVMAKQPEGDLFRASLPIAGLSGTLEDRFRGTPAAGIVQAKTGTLSGAVALSGYVSPVQHPPLVFSLILNHGGASNQVSRGAIDEIVVLLATLRSCP